MSCTTWIRHWAIAGHNKNLIQRLIDYTDNQIDKLVYNLYDLTEDEIQIVERESS